MEVGETCKLNTILSVMWISVWLVLLVWKPYACSRYVRDNFTVA